MQRHLPGIKIDNQGFSLTELMVVLPISIAIAFMIPKFLSSLATTTKLSGAKMSVTEVITDIRDTLYNTDNCALTFSDFELASFESPDKLNPNYPIPNIAYYTTKEDDEYSLKYGQGDRIGIENILLDSYAVKQSNEQKESFLFTLAVRFKLSQKSKKLIEKRLDIKYEPDHDGGIYKCFALSSGITSHWVHTRNMEDIYYRRGRVGIFNIRDWHNQVSKSVRLQTFGAIRGSDDQAECNENTVGSLRYNPAKSIYEFCLGDSASFQWGGMGTALTISAPAGGFAPSDGTIAKTAILNDGQTKGCILSKISFMQNHQCEIKHSSPEWFLQDDHGPTASGYPACEMICF